MNNEVKEILDSIKSYIIQYKDEDGKLELSFKEWFALLDYITNLQERIFKARKMIFDNYGVLDKYEIELLDDILKGDE